MHTNMSPITNSETPDKGEDRQAFLAKHKSTTAEDVGIHGDTVNLRLNRRSNTAVGKVKADRLFKKNQRRMANGLPPILYNEF